MVAIDIRQRCFALCVGVFSLSLALTAVGFRALPAPTARRHGGSHLTRRHKERPHGDHGTMVPFEVLA